jgi:hypothetical protein
MGNFKTPCRELLIWPMYEWLNRNLIYKKNAPEYRAGFFFTKISSNSFSRGLCSSEIFLNFFLRKLPKYLRLASV